MGKKVKRLFAGVLIAGSILGASTVAYAKEICPRCWEGTLYYSQKCNDWHCTKCGCLAQY